MLQPTQKMTAIKPTQKMDAIDSKKAYWIYVLETIVRGMKG